MPRSLTTTAPDPAEEGAGAEGASADAAAVEVDDVFDVSARATLESALGAASRAQAAMYRPAANKK